MGEGIWGRAGSIILIVIVIFLILFLFEKNLWGAVKSFSGLGDEFDETPEQMKSKAEITFNDFFDEIQECLKSKKNDCTCLIPEFPEFPSDYSINFIKSGSGMKIVLKDKSDVSITSKTLEDVDLCYLTNKYIPEFVNEVTINFDKRSYYTEDGYEFSNLVPLYKHKNYLCFITSKMWTVGGYKRVANPIEHFTKHYKNEATTFVMNRKFCN